MIIKQVILGIGNQLNGDDGAGIHVIERLEHNRHDLRDTPLSLERELIIINAGTHPEAFTSVIRRHNPHTLVMVDAADMGLSPGDFRVIPTERIAALLVTTHSIPLLALVSYMDQFCRQVILIGIQPRSLDTGSPLSASVARSADTVARLILKNRLNEIRPLET